MVTGIVEFERNNWFLSDASRNKVFAIRLLWGFFVLDTGHRPRLLGRSHGKGHLDLSKPLMFVLITPPKFGGIMYFSIYCESKRTSAKETISFLGAFMK